MKETSSYKIKYIKKPKTDAQFGVPLKGRGRLGADNIYIPEEKKEKRVKPVIAEAPEVTKAAVQEADLTPVQTPSAAIVEASRDLPETREKKSGKRSLKAVVGNTRELFRVDGNTRVVSVNTAEKKKRISGSTVVTVLFFLVLLLFVAMNNVQYFENEKMINELKQSFDESRELERKLTAELEQKYDLSEIGDYASSELGMVGSENNKKVYIDIGEDESVEVYEPETEDYGTIVTIMNALGDTFKAWIDVFG